MKKIVFTGGPSSGKSSIINRVVEQFKELGYKMIVVPEAVTLAINSGIKPFGEDAIPGSTYQRIILERQMMMEATSVIAANVMGNDLTIILCDRGTLDGYAYVTDKEWEEVLADAKVTKRELLSSYDAVIYLEDASSYFTKENNAARYENNAEEAREKGEKVLKSYNSHDNLIVIQPRENFEEKQQEVVGVIQELLGNPVPINMQRKFLVSSIEFEKLASIASKVVIKQDYLKEENGLQYRIREVNQDGDCSYHYNVQKKLVDGKREIVKEATLNRKDYKRYLASKNEDYETVEKCRYSFVYKEQYYKLDIFPDGMMILEVNITKENPNLMIPEFVNAIEEVTNNPEYMNIGIARKKGTTYGKRKINSY